MSTENKPTAPVESVVMHPIDDWNVLFTGETEGASDLAACENRRGSICECQPACAVCGLGEHHALHCAIYGQPPGSGPWGHSYRTESA